jgi:hypothetical protein
MQPHVHVVEDEEEMVESVGMSSDNCRPVLVWKETPNLGLPRSAIISALLSCLLFSLCYSIIRPHACGCLRLRRARSTIHSSNMAHLIIITSVDKRAKSVGICTCKFCYISFALRQLPFPQQVTS